MNTNIKTLNTSERLYVLFEGPCECMDDNGDYQKIHTVFAKFMLTKKACEHMIALCDPKGIGSMGYCDAVCWILERVFKDQGIFAEATVFENVRGHKKIVYQYCEPEHLNVRGVIKQLLQLLGPDLHSHMSAVGFDRWDLDRQPWTFRNGKWKMRYKSELLKDSMQIAFFFPEQLIDACWVESPGSGPELDWREMEHVVPHLCVQMRATDWMRIQKSGWVFHQGDERLLSFQWSEQVLGWLSGLLTAHCKSPQMINWVNQAPNRQIQSVVQNPPLSEQLVQWVSSGKSTGVYVPKSVHTTEQFLIDVFKKLGLTYAFGVFPFETSIPYCKKMQEYWLIEQEHEHLSLAVSGVHQEQESPLDCARL